MCSLVIQRRCAAPVNLGVRPLEVIEYDDFDIGH
jgi:hypothetical protein